MDLRDKKMGRVVFRLCVTKMVCSDEIGVCVEFTLNGAVLTDQLGVSIAFDNLPAQGFSL